jgi:hypothetical protein
MRPCTTSKKRTRPALPVAAELPGFLRFTAQIPDFWPISGQMNAGVSRAAPVTLKW